MLDKIKSILLAVLAGFSFVIFSLYKRQKTAAEQIREDTARQAAELQRDANKAMQQGLVNEAKIREKMATDPHKRVDLE